MMPEPSFKAYGPSHLITLGCCLAVYLILWITRHHSPRKAVWLERALGSLLVLLWPITTLTHWHAGTLRWDNALPLHFCDVAGLAGAVALWTRRQLPCEIVYFFGLAGTLQGLLTPNLEFDFPDGRFLVFFFLHGGVVVTALHVVTAMGHAPRPWSVARMMAVTLTYAGIVGSLNAVLGTNYGFLAHKPERASLMDVLGPWPWYIGSLIVLAVAFYAILDLPFMIRRRVRHESS